MNIKFLLGNSYYQSAEKEYIGGGECSKSVCNYTLGNESTPVEGIEMCYTGRHKEWLSVRGYTQEQVEVYFEKAGEITKTKTHGRIQVATLNKMIEYLRFSPCRWIMENYIKLCISSVNRDLCHATGFEDYGYPVEFLEEDMKRTGII